MLKIRAFEDDDLQLLNKWLNKKYIKKWFEVPDICTIDDWLHEVKNRNGEFNWLSYFIVQSDDCPVGFCTYYKCVDAKEDWYDNISLDGVYSIDYLIGEEEYLGKGIGKKMIAKLVEMIFEHEDAKRIIVQPDKNNRASSSVLLSNGFIFEDNIYGITKKEYCMRTGRI
jgi:Acetyltransferases, including N-acetylases of ribosomal proteins